MKLFSYIAVIVLLFILSGCNKSSTQNENKSFENNEFQQQNKEDIKSSYQKDLLATLEPYWNTGKTEGIKDAIVSLKTPAEFLDLHLSLVIAFDLIEQGNADNDLEKINQGEQKITEAAEEYSWIKPQ